MSCPKRNIGLLIPILLAGLGYLCAAGCQSLPRSGLDPSGERLFESRPLQGLKPSECNLFGRRTEPSSAVPVPITATPVPGPAPITSAGSTSATSLLPGGLGQAFEGGATLPQYGSTATSASTTARGVNTALITSPDAGPSPVFEDTGGYALPTEPIEGPAILMTPREQIAPVGSEVVLIASYLGNKNRLITNEKMEWTLEGVGSILKYDPGSCCDPLFFDYVRAKKISDRYTVTKTSQVYRNLDRGTPETRDDIHLLRGQTWISVNSIREGTTHVTAFAPGMKDWSKRSDFGIIHWVDAQWVLPQLPLAPVGESRVLTTSVLRRTNGQPRADWIVRYEVLNGPAGGFGPSLAQIQEVKTDVSGQASVVLSQRDQQSGTNTIAVRIIRPSGVDGSDRSVTVGSETIRQSWTGSAGVRVRVQGPESSAIGKDTPYTITISNSMPTIANGILALTFPPTATFSGGNPPPLQQDPTLVQWNVAVPPNASTTIQCNLRPGSAGRMIPEAKFYPQGISPIPGTSIPTTSVPLTPSGPTGSPRPADAASVVPVAPGEGASIYRPGTGSLPIVNQPAPAGGALIYSGLELSIIPVVDPTESLVFQVGKPCQVAFLVKNNDRSEQRNLVLQLSIPPEYRTRLTSITATPKAELNGQESVKLEIPVLGVGATAKVEIKLPDIAAAGCQFTGTVLINGKEVTKTQKAIVPPK